MFVEETWKKEHDWEKGKTEVDKILARGRKRTREWNGVVHLITNGKNCDWISEMLNISIMLEFLITLKWNQVVWHCVWMKQIEW